MQNIKNIRKLKIQTEYKMLIAHFIFNELRVVCLHACRIFCQKLQKIFKMVGNTGANLFYPFCNSTQAKCNGQIVTEGNERSQLYSDEILRP